MRNVFFNEIKILSARNRAKLTALMDNFTWEICAQIRFYENGPIFGRKKKFREVVGGSSFGLGEDFGDFRAYLDE